MATIQDVFSHVYTTEASLSKVPVKNGQIILCTDSEKLYIDHGTTRVSTSDVVQVENQEALPLAPLDKLYITKDTCDVYFYINDEWKKITEQLVNDYTAFEVYPTNAVISAGTTDAVTGLTYTHDVPADMTHTFKVRSCTPQATCDVVIDWGDGATSSVAKKEYTAYDTSELASDTEVTYQFQHTYSTPGRYIVKILGRDYFGFRALDNYAEVRSIMSRCLDYDLPIASCVTNLAHAFSCTYKLLKVKIATVNNLYSRINNAAQAFAYNVNLVSCTNMKTMFQYTRTVMRMFYNDKSLRECDMRLPAIVGEIAGYSEVFYNCIALEGDIANFFPKNGFVGPNVYLDRTFNGCAKLTGTLPANMLWKRAHIRWINTVSTFAGCSDAIRAQAPTSWGGTSTDAIVGDLPVAKLSLNGTLPNTANGLVILNADGKVDNALLPAQADPNIDNYTSNNTINLTSTAGAVNLLSRTGEAGLYSGDKTFIKVGTNDISITGTGKINLTTGSLQYNGVACNAPNGLVQLNENGKLSSDLYDAIDLSNYKGSVALTASGEQSIVLKYDDGGSGSYNDIITMENGHVDIDVTSGVINMMAHTVMIGTQDRALSEASINAATFLINASDVMLNNNGLNSANGLVQLDSTGKVPTTVLPKMTKSWTKQTINQSSFTTDDSTYGGKYMELSGICSIEVYDANGYKVEFDVKCDFTNNKTRIYIPSGLAAATISNWTLLYVAKDIA